MKNILAAFSFFTRIPFWRMVKIPADTYRHVVDFWPLAGWLTGGVTALALWGFLQILPVFAAVVLAYTVRLIVTGALHEDGFADFIDGFGGGTDRARILEIMKDSHIGSYGVVGLIVYFLTLAGTVSSLPASIMPLVVFAADPWGKFCGSLVVDFLPYVRPEQEAKNRLTYDRMTLPAILMCLVAGLIPSLSLATPLRLSLILPLLVACIGVLYLRRKIGGYTGDCCGAMAVTCELAYLLSAVVILRLLV